MSALDSQCYASQEVYKYCLLKNKNKGGRLNSHLPISSPKLSERPERIDAVHVEHRN